MDSQCGRSPEPPSFSLSVFSLMCQLSVVESKSATFPSEKARHLLDDSVLESRSPRRALAASSAATNGISLGKRLCLSPCVPGGFPAGVPRAREAFASSHRGFFPPPPVWWAGGRCSWTKTRLARMATAHNSFKAKQGPAAWGPQLGGPWVSPCPCPSLRKRQY